MYVCICNSVTDKQIRRAAAGGVDNLYELRDSLGVAACCGTCARQAEEILNEFADAGAGPREYTPVPA